MSAYKVMSEIMERIRGKNLGKGTSRDRKTYTDLTSLQISTVVFLRNGTTCAALLLIQYFFYFVILTANCPKVYRS